MKQSISKSQKIILGTLLTSTLLGSSFSVMADDKKTMKAKSSEKVLTERSISSSFPGWKDPVMGNIAVYSGQALIRHLQMAKATLEEKKLGEAKGALTAAKDFAGGLRKMIPFLVVVDQVKDAKGKVLESADSIVVDDMLPVYKNIDQMEIYAPELAKKARGKLKEAQKLVKAGKKKQAGEKLDEVIDDITATTVYMPVIYISKEVNQALKALDGKEPNTKVAKADINAALNSLVAASVDIDIMKKPKGVADKAKAKNQATQQSSKEISPAVRAKLTRVKQSVAFAENMQIEAKHDPQDIYQGLDNASVIVNKILATDSLAADVKTKLESVKAGIKTIKANLNDKLAYAKVRKLLEGLTDNPGE